MSHYNSDPSLIEEIRTLQRRLTDLEQRGVVVPTFSNTTRPPAASMPNALIRNSSTGTLQWSDGSSWTNT